MNRVAAVLLAGVLWGGCEKEEEKAPAKGPSRVSRGPGGEVIVTLAPEEVERIGLELKPLAAETLRPEATAYGRALDPAPLIALDSELTAAEAALEASKADAERSRALQRDGGAVSQRALEAAEAQFRADEARMTAARQRMRLEGGTLAGELDPAARRKWVSRLAGLEAQLVRVDLSAGEAIDAPPKAARLAVVGYEGRAFVTSNVAAAPRVDPAAQGQGFLLLVDDPPPFLRPGAAVTAFLELPGAPQTGVVIPRSALVRHGGKAWAYVRIEGGEPEEKGMEPRGDKAPSKEEKKGAGGGARFTRREVALARPVAAGWFTPSGFAPGDRVVVVGAQALMSEELISQTRPEAGGDPGEK